MRWDSSLHYSREFVTLRHAQGPEPSRGTKPLRRHARRARGAAKEGSLLEQYVEGASGEPAHRRLVAVANPRLQQTCS